jgi:hypothetical protein
VKRAVLVLIAACLLHATFATAQEERAPHRHLPRRWLIAGIGVALTGAASIWYASNNHGLEGSCASTRCVATLTMVTGFSIGYLVGHEFDQLYEQRYRHAPPLELHPQRMPLSVIPYDIATRAGAIAAAGENGVEVVTGIPTFQRTDVRARGLRGVVAALPDPAANRLLVGTATGLYGFALTGDRVSGSLLAPGEIAALDLRGDRALAASDGALRTARLAGDSLAAISTGHGFPTRVTDVAWDPERNVAWILTEITLFAFAMGDSGLADSLGAVELPGTGRRLAVRGTSVAVAAGEGGVAVYDGADPRALRETSRWSRARFAYDVALGPTDVYVAAGPEGLYVLLPQPDGTMQPLGLARNLGFVSALAVDGDYLILLDRSGGFLRRIPIAP